jgi:hypothetical protein
MAFNALFLAHAKDADIRKHRAFIDTGIYQLNVVIVKNQTEALAVIGTLTREKRLDSIMLCPGFTHADVAEIVAATDRSVAVCPARGDGPSSRIALEALKRAGAI